MKKWFDKHISIWINPFFWEHPTPLNMLMIIAGILVALLGIVWIVAWFGYFAATVVPWPPR